MLRSRAGALEEQKEILHKITPQAADARHFHGWESYWGYFTMHGGSRDNVQAPGGARVHALVYF